LEDSSTFALLAKSPHAHAGAIYPELLQTLRPLEGFFPSSFSHRWRIKCLSAYSSLQQPLAESFWVFNNLVNILQWILPPAPELKEFFSSSVPECTKFQFPPGRVSSLSQNVQQFYLLYPVPLCTCSMPT
jgi:hypothetical protein